MSKTKTKRRQLWVWTWPDGTLGYPAHLARAACPKPAVRFVEARPGDTLLSREDAEELRSIVAAVVREREYPLHYGRFLALLRGRR